MKTVVILCSLLLVTVAASTSAQDLNFELDNFANATYGRSPPTGFIPPLGPTASGLWVGNPNVRHEFVQQRDSRGAVHTVPTGCVFVPRRFNTARGDTVLSAAPGSIVHTLLTSIGQDHSHSGMAASSTSIRHNTLEEGALKSIDSSGIPQYAKPTGDRSLRDGWPGMLTQTVEAATSWEEFNLLDGIVLYSHSPTGFADSAAQTSRRSAQRSAAETQMRAMRGFYRLYAYTNMNWRDPFTQANNDGNMCSGSVYYAHALAGNPYWTPDAWVDYSASVRSGAASTLYGTIRSHLLSQGDWLSDAIMLINELGGGTARTDIATRVANQAVNCMAFNDCGNRTSRWRNGVGSGRTMSPDDLLNFAVEAVVVSAWAGVDVGFVYNGAKALEVTGNYYCCTDRDSRGVNTTSCSSQ